MCPIFDRIEGLAEGLVGVIDRALEVLKAYDQMLISIPFEPQFQDNRTQHLMTITTTRRTLIRHRERAMVAIRVVQTRRINMNLAADMSEDIFHSIRR